MAEKNTNGRSAIQTSSSYVNVSQSKTKLLFRFQRRRFRPDNRRSQWPAHRAVTTTTTNRTLIDPGSTIQTGWSPATGTKPTKTGSSDSPRASTLPWTRPVSTRWTTGTTFPPEIKPDCMVEPEVVRLQILLRGTNSFCISTQTGKTSLGLLFKINYSKFFQSWQFYNSV